MTSIRKPRTSTVLHIEPLEPRLAPAVTIVNPLTATFTDVDGDLVTVRVSKGVLSPGLFTTVPSGFGDQLQRLNLSAGGFDGANVTITSRARYGGDGFVNVGYINSTGHDLGNVSVDGDLAQIDAGNGDTIIDLKTLTARSMGKFGLSTQGGVGGSLDSKIEGRLGRFVLTGDMDKTYLTARVIDAITIGGSLIGGANFDSGRINAQDIGTVVVRGHVLGGSGHYSGSITSHGWANSKIKSVVVGKSIEGGSGSFSGSIWSRGTQPYPDGGIGPVRVGAIVGGSGGLSGSVYSRESSLGNVTITGWRWEDGFFGYGHLLGGTGYESGIIAAKWDIGHVRIRDVMQGPSIWSSEPSVRWSGVISSFLGNIAGVSVGTIRSGQDYSSAGDLRYCGTIHAGGSIGYVQVQKDIDGQSSSWGTSRVVIAARRGMGRISVGGNVTNTDFLAGYTENWSGSTIDAVNPDAQIGSVWVRGNWTASNLIAGVADGGNGFGNGGDARISGPDDLAVPSAISRVVILGTARGTPSTTSSSDHYGIVAQHIGSLIVGRTRIPLAFGPANDQGGFAIGDTGDFAVREVAL